MTIANLGDIFIRFIADYAVILIVLIAGWVMLRLPRKVRYQYIAKAVVAGLLALLFAKIASLLYQDAARPFQLLGVDAKAAYLSNPGFPSDHMLLVGMIALVVWASTKNVRISLVLTVLALMVGLGRILALVHSPQDVLGSIACVLLAGLLVYGKTLWSTRPPKS